MSIGRPRRPAAASTRGEAVGSPAAAGLPTKPVGHFARELVPQGQPIGHPVLVGFGRVHRHLERDAQALGRRRRSSRPTPSRNAPASSTSLSATTTAACRWLTLYRHKHFQLQVALPDVRGIRSTPPLSPSGSAPLVSCCPTGHAEVAVRSPPAAADAIVRAGTSAAGPHRDINDRALRQTPETARLYANVQDKNIAWKNIKSSTPKAPGNPSSAPRRFRWAGAHDAVPATRRGVTSGCFQGCNRR